MEKLELKHLAPYLPYGLKYFIDYTDGDTEIVNLDGAFIDELYFDNGLTCGYESETIKPILRPLSDFKKTIIGNIKKELDISHNQCMEFLGFMDSEIKLDNVSVGLYIAMCKAHIDFNQLIEKGLAIDINTIK